MAKNNDWKKVLIKELMSSFGLKREEIIEFNETALVAISSKYSLKKVNLAFSLGALPNCKGIAAGTITEQAGQVIELIKSMSDITFTLHVFSISEKYGVMTTGRAELLRDKLKKLNKTTEPRKSFFQKHKSSLQQGLIQILILPDRSLAISLVQASQLSFYGALLPSHAGGFLTIKEDKVAPSRAYRKIKEAQVIMDRYFERDQVVVDLGACPGGWSYIALQSDAKVIAIDRSELAADLMVNPRVEFLKTDAFKYVTDFKVDWVISDIICHPKRIQELMKNWLAPQKATNFVFTLKFQGESDYEIVQEFKKLMMDYPSYSFLLRQLNTNKNEATLMGHLI